MQDYSKSRNVDGFLLLDKPYNISSNTALQEVKKIFNARKAGHAGSLDPIATGMLLVCFGEATKFVKYLINLDKRYQVILKLGESTSTFDSEGELLKSSIVDCSYTKIIKVLKKFIGKTYQIPPLYSAIKYKGQSLYKYVRSGITNIPLMPRKIIIYQLKYINRFKNFIELYIWCSKGTYVRSLINDIGQQLHCGAHVVFLRRLQIGSFSKNNLFALHTLYELKKNLDTNDESCYKTIDALLLPLHTSEILFPLIYISMKQSLCFSKGQKILLSHVNNINICVRVIAERKKKFLGIGFINKYKYLIPRRVSSILFS